MAALSTATLWLLVVAAQAHATWFWAWARRRFDVADIAWGLGGVGTALIVLLSTPRHPRLWLCASGVVAWGVRLAWHIGRRHQRSAEDPRYAAWRTAWGRWADLRAYGQIFWLQAILLSAVCAPLWTLRGAAATPLGALDYAGAALWALGISWEVIADAQLAAFRGNTDNRGRLLTTGLWRYSRHPNYFGEIVLWWGIGLIAAAAPGGWPALLGPLVITGLICGVSGIPLLEARYADRADFQAYARRTNALIPWFPRRSA